MPVEKAYLIAGVQVPGFRATGCAVEPNAGSGRLTGLPICPRPVVLNLVKAQNGAVGEVQLLLISYVI